MKRICAPEWLDELPATDVRAIRSRADLRRLNWLMNSAGILSRALAGTVRVKPTRVADIGCGDGSLTLRVAMNVGWRDVEFVLVDRTGEIRPAVRDAFRAMKCQVTFVPADVLSGLESLGEVDVMFTNLFLRHFNEADLRRLFRTVAPRTHVFAACEPRRSNSALFASKCVGLVGCNAVTRHDAVVSVRAGFRDDELTQLWPANHGWRCRENGAGLFSHLFVAERL